MAYAVGKHSRAICDRCGFEYGYLELREEWTGFKVCYDCYEVKHPQLEPIHTPSDGEALHQPRPDRKEPLVVNVGENIFGVSEPLKATSQVGVVTVVIS